MQHHLIYKNIWILSIFNTIIKIGGHFKTNLKINFLVNVALKIELHLTRYACLMFASLGMHISISPNHKYEMNDMVHYRTYDLSKAINFMLPIPTFLDVITYYKLIQIHLVKFHIQICLFCANPYCQKIRIIWLFGKASIS
jgi:hypothetical protein